MYTLSANELMALLGGEKNSKRCFEILSNVLAETDYAELEIATNHVIFGEDTKIVTYDHSVEAFFVKETDSPPVYPNGLTSLA